MKKMVKRQRGMGHMTYFLNSGTPLISLERLKIQTSDSICGLRVRNTKPNKMLSYRRETALQGTLVLAESGRLELRDNILLIL